MPSGHGSPTDGCGTPPSSPCPPAMPSSIDAHALQNEGIGLWLRWQAAPGPNYLAQTVGRTVAPSVDNAGEQADDGEQ